MLSMPIFVKCKYADFYENLPYEAILKEVKQNGYLINYVDEKRYSDTQFYDLVKMAIETNPFAIHNYKKFDRFLYEEAKNKILSYRILDYYEQQLLKFIEEKLSL